MLSKKTGGLMQGHIIYVIPVRITLQSNVIILIRQIKIYMWQDEYITTKRFETGIQAGP